MSENFTFVLKTFLKLLKSQILLFAIIRFIFDMF